MKHVSVLKSEVLDQFSYLKGKAGIFVDGTLGMAGHSLSLENISDKLKIIGIDADEEALGLVKKELSVSKHSKNFILVHNNFKSIKKILVELNIEKIDGALLDLGVSSMQLDQKDRGFSFQDSTQLLDMRMDQTRDLTAAKILNFYKENQLSQIIFNYGEEKFARIIAKNIIEFRKKTPITTIHLLLNILDISIPKSVQMRSKTHFATKTFQALRIEVNGELDGLDQAIKDFASVLRPGGRLAVISFHSLEDRIVKKTFSFLAHPCQCPSEMPCICGLVPEIKILTKKPIIPSAEETTNNPRSRSAKLRVLEKISNTTNK
ncbi:16S rRNA (cytosine(1402)-N(4))-methyltransferase [Candidatus Berkelbacteria bacterium CG10_big_fil_rev_8_21_14_0_10_43_13]|uniref:Ribosomal RNA small subunit methyltransferase H n=1 Tax=Candidatus Berkelbacteria bacterium CG10_big_fil_rev_8_21_14_0_10_43_13 TaxID=1974514 RepID=A0A2H0W6N9_9BACT|nr:MAG: 16S rRNA (cytosine(1402)-N(4))-methyltransferase [Candidatus Berkelbacteria bacterium CG10_big_fil_rev_8_21_14_0_10_43_13]